jgi:hypothetical protein
VHKANENSLYQIGQNDVGQIRHGKPWQGQPMDAYELIHRELTRIGDPERSGELAILAPCITAA